MRITTVGRGKVGGSLASLWERAGHRVTRLGREGGDASASDVLLVAVPPWAVEDCLGRLTGLAGQVVIDAMNALDGRDESYESLTHQVKATVGGPAAKAFNLQHHLLYRRLGFTGSRPSNLFAADDGARASVEQLSRDAGFDPVYVGGLENARALEDAVSLFGAIRVHNGDRPHFHRFATPDEL